MATGKTAMQHYSNTCFAGQQYKIATSGVDFLKYVRHGYGPIEDLGDFLIPSRVTCPLDTPIFPQNTLSSLPHLLSTLPFFPLILAIHLSLSFSLSLSLSLRAALVPSPYLSLPLSLSLLTSARRPLSLSFSLSSSPTLHAVAAAHSPSPSFSIPLPASLPLPPSLSFPVPAPLQQCC
ncbi:hypothetical protein AAC387_Pa01g1450 [Persea americana]